jgi:uncharacterized protein (DUF885 family)
MPIRNLFTFLLLIFTVAPGKPAAGQGIDSVAPSEMQPVLERYSTDRSTLMRSLATDVSPARRGRMKEFYDQWQKSLAQVRFDTLGQPGQIDYLLLKNNVDYELLQLDLQAKNLAEVETVVPFSRTIVELEEARRKMEWADPVKSASALNEMNKQIERTRRAVEAGLRPEGRGAAANAPQAAGDAPIRPKKTAANRAAMVVNTLRNTLRNWYTFYNGYDPMFTWWVESPFTAVDRLLQDYAAFLRERVAGLPPETPQPPAAGAPGSGRGAGGGQADSVVAGRGGARGGGAAEPGSTADIIGDPIGRDALVVELAHEMIPYTPEELIALANKEYAWCENEMKTASRQLGYGDDWRKALEYIKTRYVEPGKQPEFIRGLVLEAIRYMDDHDLVTIPSLARETWRMEMMSPQRQLVNPFFLGGEVIQVSYPTNTMTHEQKLMSMRGNNRHFSHATAFHEVIPGHHLQGFMASRYRNYRSPFGTSFFTEGWALYWEFLLYDMGFHKTPEDKIGALFWRMHRCARIIFSLSFHMEKMTPQECVDFLVQKVGFERENAIGEVRRSFDGSYGPLYQAAYMLGGMQIYNLRKELVDSGRMTNRAFHDALLKENRIPLELMRAVLTKQKLTQDFSSVWRFAN